MVRCFFVIIFALVVVFDSASALAWRDSNPPIGSIRTPLPESLNFWGENVSSYQIGDEFSRPVLRAQDIPNQTPVVRQLGFSILRVGSATGFYLTQVGDFAIIATNHHVVESWQECRSTNVEFFALKIRGRCTEWIGTWPDLDFTLFAVRLSPGDLATIRNSGARLEFDWQNPIASGDPLVTMGFGIAGNQQRTLTINQDADCKVFSAANDFRWMPDPDRFNPGPDKVWSFANGCDVSHGDSGSPILSRETGKVYGILWTGTFPKAAEIRSSANLETIRQNNDPKIWEHLTYAAPAAKILPILQQHRTSPACNQICQVAIQALTPDH
jgi:hypothetical protein